MELAIVKVYFVFTVSNSIAPEVRVTPHSFRSQEDINSIELQCGIRLPLPLGASLVWSFGKVSLGSFTNNQIHVLHKSQIGNVYWNGTNFGFQLDNPTRKNTGIYECCVLTRGHYKHCDRANVSIWSLEDHLCTGITIKPSNPFQINYFHFKPLLRNGSFETLVWTFNMTDWKISTRFPQCVSHLTNLEMGLAQWFGQHPLITQRDKRGVVEGILGGVGTIGSLLNTMDINTLKSDLGSIGYIGSKGVTVQKGLNQLLEKMVLNTSTVIGSSVSHLQDATLELIESQQEVQVSRACLEIQVEYSTNLKMMAQALQSGVTPLGLLRSLPEKYSFSLNHIDLWINKWLGCDKEVCIAS
ncbi:uncharacterized protein LOC130298266 [Hyla sarda]|uniref:uncharacterized protein LOC130298266 n=1 Tax=Hyla sarda TaxID=327740 RepID=UPI0024C33BE4|nr:uncharacterized protein LOC130298266 [Hyla sarda]